MSLVELERCDFNLAEIVRGRLEAAGIAAFCFDEGASGVLGQGVAVRVMVEEEDLGRARELLAHDAAQSGTQSGTPPA